MLNFSKIGDQGCCTFRTSGTNDVALSNIGDIAFFQHRDQLGCSRVGWGWMSTAFGLQSETWNLAKTARESVRTDSGLISSTEVPMLDASHSQHEVEKRLFFWLAEKVSVVRASSRPAVAYPRNRLPWNLETARWRYLPGIILKDLANKLGRDMRRGLR